MTSIQRTALQTLRLAGYAVVTFTPEEVGQEDPAAFESYLVEKGVEYLTLFHEALEESCA